MMKLHSYPGILLLCLSLAGCGGDDALPPSDDGGWSPVLGTRADAGTEGVVAGFADADAYSPQFYERVVSDGTAWQWSDGTVPPLDGVGILAAAVPYIKMSSATTTLRQSSLDDYPQGLMLGAVPLTDPAAYKGIPVKQCLAQMDISCEGSYFLDSSIELYLSSSATIDFREGTLTTKNSKSYHDQQMEDRRTALLTILPQTFKRGNRLFRYTYGSDNSVYSYTLKEDFTVGPGQCLYVSIASGDEDVYTPQVTISVATQVEDWQPGNGSGGESVEIE